MTDVPKLFDPALRRLRLARAQRLAPGPTFLQTAMLENCAERVGFMARRFSHALLLGDVTPAHWPDLADRRSFGLADDVAREKLSVEAASVDLIVSIGQLHVTNDVPGMLMQFCRALKPDGLMIACFPGGDTLHELRAALLNAESRLTNGAGLHVHPMMDVRDGGTLLQRTGFAMPVADLDRMQVTYATPIALMQDLRSLGETAVLTDRTGSRLNRKVIAAAGEAYAAAHATAAGRVTATYTLVTLSGWAPEASQPQPKRRGSATARLADVLGTVERKS
jgi:SAM-dependent methyltransferase